MSVEDKAVITKAGAEVFEAELKRVTKAKHYRKANSDLHLADSIVMQNTNSDGMKNGNSTVGFDEKKAYIANFIENGTKFPMYNKRSSRKYKHGGQVAVKADHFIRDLRESSDIQQRMLEAEAAAMKKIIDKRNS
jgi:hypothetical protein